MTDTPPVQHQRVEPGAVHVDPAAVHVADDLQRFVLGSTHVQEFLAQLARHASEALTDDVVVHCGVTLLRDRRPASVASSSERARYMDEMQHSYDEGPCLSAARDGAVYHASDLATETRWPVYIGQIRGAGINSIMAVPFDLEDEALGALNLYGETPIPLTWRSRRRPCPTRPKPARAFGWPCALPRWRTGPRTSSRPWPPARSSTWPSG